MTIRNLFISLGFEIDTQSEKQVEAAIQGLKKRRHRAGRCKYRTTPGRRGKSRRRETIDLVLGDY